MKNSASPRLWPREVRSGRSASGGPLPSADTACSFREVRCPQRTIEYQFERYLVGVAAEGSGPPGKRSGEPACFEGLSQECHITVNRVLSWFYTVFVGFINNPSPSFSNHKVKKILKKSKNTGQWEVHEIEREKGQKHDKAGVMDEKKRRELDLLIGIEVTVLQAWQCHLTRMAVSFL